MLVVLVVRKGLLVEVGATTAVAVASPVMSFKKGLVELMGTLIGVLSIKKGLVGDLMLLTEVVTEGETTTDVIAVTAVVILIPARGCGGVRLVAVCTVGFRTGLVGEGTGLATVTTGWAM